MAEQAHDRRPEITASKLRVPTHTTYYNSFFLLRTEVVLNGQPAEIGCSDSSELTLCCRYFPMPGKYSTTKPSVSFPSISAKIEDILKNHGVIEVGNFFCEDAPLFQVTFSSEYGLKKFLRSKQRVEKEMAALLSEMLQPTQQAGAPVILIPTRVNATLFLMTPNHATKSCSKPTEVTLENHSSCVAVWKESEVFDFGDVFRVFRLDPSKLQEEGEISSISVLRELLEVFEWFILGSYLGVPEHELETIKLDHLNNNKECKLKMVSTWIKLGNASWSALVRALWEIGRCGLAKKLAYKFGTTLPPAALKTRDQEVVTSDETEPSLKPVLKQPSQKESSVRSQLLSSIEHNDHRLEDTTMSVEKVTENKTKASEKRIHVKRCLSAALTKVELLLQEKEELAKQLTEKEIWLQTLENSEFNLQNLVDSLKRDVQHLRDQLEQKDREIAGVTTETNSLKAQLQETTTELVKASSKLSKLKTERETLKVDLERERRELEKVQYCSVFKDDTIKELKGELTAMTTVSKSKERELGVLEGRLFAQSEEVERLRKALQEAEQRKPALPEQPSAAIVQQQLLQIMETSDLKVALATAEEGRQEVERQLGALQRQVQFLEDEIKQHSRKEGKLCYATGPGLKEATVNRETEFSVYTVAEDGEKCVDPNAVVTGELVSEEDGSVVKCQVSKKEENRYELRYKPQHKGRFQLHVKVNGIHIKDSPFQVETLQLAQGTHVKTIDGLNNPHHLAVSDNGEIVVAEYNSNCVSVFDREGRKLLSFGNQGSDEMKLVRPRGVALLSDNTVLAAADHCAKKFRMDGTFIASVGSKGSGKMQFKEPWAVAVDERGKKIYVCDKYNHRIQVLNFDLSYHSSFRSSGTGPQQFSYPDDIAIDSHQNVFVADYGNHRVQVFDSEGRFQYQIKQRGPGMEELNNPVSVCIDRDDNVYVLEFNRCRVSIFSNKGNFIKSFGQEGNKAGEFSRPFGIAVDNSGCVYVSDTGNRRIQIFK